MAEVIIWANQISSTIGISLFIYLCFYIKNQQKANDSPEDIKKLSKKLFKVKKFKTLCILLCLTIIISIVTNILNTIL
jgi:Na+/melibiose symporter-like transporter